MRAQKLLVMDDNPEISAVFVLLGQELGLDILTTSTAADFRTEVGRFVPHVIVLDLMIPDADGIELLRFLSESQSTAQVILISGSDRKVLDSARRLGQTLSLNMAGALPKPLELSDIEIALRKAFESGDTLSGRDLLAAVESKEVGAFFQSKADLGAGRIIGAEALVRWVDPRRGVLAPGKFLPLAEQSGLMEPLTWRVAEDVLDVLEECRARGHDVGISMNLSASTLTDLTLPDRLASAMLERSLPTHLLTIELTESVAAKDRTHMFDILTRFRLKGFGLSMDDYGTGYSSLSELVQLPFNELKIDQTFVNEIGSHRDSEAVIRSTVLLAHHLEMKVCAEGVETEEQMAFLRDCGVDSVQGFLISQPLPPNEWLEFLDQHLHGTWKRAS